MGLKTNQKVISYIHATVALVGIFSHSQLARINNDSFLPQHPLMVQMVVNMKEVSSSVPAVATEVPVEGVEPHAPLSALFLLGPVGAKWAWMPGWFPGR